MLKSMFKTWGNVVEDAGLSCGLCKIFYTAKKGCRISLFINQGAFTRDSRGLYSPFYTCFYDTFNLLRVGFYTKFMSTNNNNYLLTNIFC